MYVGPYVVIDVVSKGGKPCEYVIRREGGSDRTRVTPEQIRSFVDSLTPMDSLNIEDMKDMVDSAPFKAARLPD